MDLVIAKGQALGNDYLVVDAAEAERAGAPITAALARRLCDRHFGLGADGVLVGRLDRDPFELTIRNPDGTEAEKSGNGLRIFGAWLHDRGRIGRTPFRVRLVKDTVTMQVLSRAPDGSLDLVVDIGRVSFRAEDAGFRPPAEDARAEGAGTRLDLGDGLEATVNPVSLSNPHCVVWVDTLERDDFVRRAPRLATHRAFAAGTNVQFARVAGRRRLEAWIWERGAGETLASGSSASAVAATALRLGLVEARELEVAMPGGTVEIRVSGEWDVRLRGPAQLVYRARVPADVIARWAG